MDRAPFDLASATPVALPDCAILRIGTLVGLDEHGRPLVRVGCYGSQQPVVARCAVAYSPMPETTAPPAVPVLLFLDGGDADRPVIVGFVTDTFTPAQPLLDMRVKTAGATLDDKKRLHFEASEEVVLKCGKGSITLQASGRVVIKGIELVSRAAGTNKIRGASVSIN